MTVITAGAAVPVLVAGVGLGFASGLTGGAAIITNICLDDKIIMKVARAAGVVFTVGGHKYQVGDWTL